MATLVIAGMDHGRVLHAASAVEIEVERAVAERVLTIRGRNSETRMQNLAILIGNAVGRVIAKAFR